MTVLVVGASGATGKHLVNQLVQQGSKVKIIVRATAQLPEAWKSNPNIQIITASVLDLSVETLQQYTADCDAVASCLGHHVSFKGIYGQPRKLVTAATKQLCEAIQKNTPATPVKYVLMNSSGNSNRDLKEKISFAQQCVIGLLRLLLPPHVDNEQAADYLRTEIGQQNAYVEWVAVRPDTLIDAAAVSAYKTYASPIRSAIFNAGQVSRINVAHFMSQLIHNQSLWHHWKGQMPLIYAESDK